MIKFDNVTATYKKNIGIFNISFEVKPGELVFIMGPTGAGKSTILKTIYKDLQLDSGKIFLNNKDISLSSSNLSISSTRNEIGMIFQDFKLLNDRNVYDNVALPLRIAGTSSKNIKHMVRDALNKVNMPGYEFSYPLELSGGEQQRIAIARAVVNNRKIILADEPTGNLDPNISDEILDLLETFTANGSAVLMSTHNFPLIKPRNKKFIELSKGRMV